MNQLVNTQSILRAIIICAIVPACGGTSNPNPSPTPTPTTNPSPKPDAGPAEDSGTTEVVNGCTSFTDLTQASAPTINGPMDPLPAQFSPNCVMIHAGQSVTWNVLLSVHILAAFGGDSPNPIQTTSSGTSVTFTFPTAGTFGYHCATHPTQMFGAVKVE